MSLGIPMPKGMALDASACSICDQSGSPVPVQWRSLERWPDGSLRWLLADWKADCPALQAAQYRLCIRESASAPLLSGLAVDANGDTVTVNTGVATFRLSVGAPLPFADVTVDGTPRLAPRGSQLVVTDQGGIVRPFVATSLTVEEIGPLRVMVRADGHAQGAKPLEVKVRAEFFEGMPTARISVTLHNSRRASHPGGIWVLGDPGSFHFKECAVSFALRDAHAAPSTALSLDVAEGSSTTGTGFELQQSSSGGAAWNSSNHVDRHGMMALTQQGWQLTDENRSVTTGLRATPIARLSVGADSVAIAVPLFWQNFPKALAAAGHELRLSLFPRIDGRLHELQGGEQKTHTFVVTFGDDDASEPILDWARNPLVPCLQAEWYAQADPALLLPVGKAATDGEAIYDAIVTGGVDGREAFSAKAERIDEFGWRNFGDLFADHEAVGDAGRSVTISHYNNQYDAVAGFALQFMRSGDLRWRRLMLDLASHVYDIDIYHTTEDKAAFNGGLFWHTAHYTDAATSTHRSFPRLPGVAGGGPSNEHCYSLGLLLHHLMTGEPTSREAVLALAQWVIDIDDGSKTVFRWLAAGATGLASSTADTLYHGPGRGAGNAILTLLNADRLEPRGPWLNKAEALIRRCIHPSDDIDRRNLLDAERRWSYTVFLQALLRYLERKLELGQCDDTFAYAWASFMAYARWMRHHEYPYLDKPEILEYPNETWSAQDLRKAEIFYAAALIGGRDEADVFRERGDFFFDYSIRALAASPTSYLTRPMVLLLAQGMRARGARDRRRHWPLIATMEPDGTRPFPPAVDFEPQKARAIRRARILATGLLAMGGLALAVVVWLALGARA